MTWKIRTLQITEEIYDSLISRRMFPEEQKGYRKWTRGTGDLSCIVQHIFKDNKTKGKNLVMAWTDYEKAYNIVLQNWIIDCFKMDNISCEFIKFIENTM